MPDLNDGDHTRPLPRPSLKLQIVPSLSNREEAVGSQAGRETESAPDAPSTVSTTGSPIPDSAAPAFVPPQPVADPLLPHDESQGPSSYEDDEPTAPAYLKPKAIPPRLESSWKVAAESVRGTSHEKTETVCQDNHHLLTLPNQVLLAAVSDGAGSAAKAEVGSEIAAKSAVEMLRRSLDGASALPVNDAEWETLLWNALDTARSDVEAEAAKQGVNARDLACTLIVLLATPEMVVVGQIGDGAAVVSDSDNNLIALTAPQSGEYLNETTFLISPKAMEQAQTRVWRGKVTYLAAFSDGLQMLALKMSDGTPHPPFFTPLFRFIHEMEDMTEAKSQLNSFLRSPRITQRADDDLTLLLAHWPL